MVIEGKTPNDVISTETNSSLSVFHMKNSSAI